MPSISQLVKENEELSNLLDLNQQSSNPKLDAVTNLAKVAFIAIYIFATEI